MAVPRGHPGLRECDPDDFDRHAQAFGLFLSPISIDLGIGRGGFGLAIALQNLIWGAVQPLTGLVADKYGAGRVLVTGSVLYALGLVVMAFSNSALALHTGAGVLIGLGLSASSFGVVMGVVARSFDPARRSWALGVVGAGGSFGQFAMLPYGQALINAAGWRGALLLLAVSALSMLLLAVPLAGKPAVRQATIRTPFAARWRKPCATKGFGSSRSASQSAASKRYS